MDSGSTDGTVALARSLGARVEHRSFTDYAEQKNAAIAMATRTWVLSVDADEVLSTDLADAIARATASAGTTETGFRVRRRLVFLGRKLRFGKSSDSPLRLFKKDLGRFEAAIHEQVVLKGGSTGTLAGELLHYSYDDLSDYFKRFNVYTSRVAENHQKLGHKMPPGLVHVLRPWTEFVTRYFLRLGFLDGYAGYTYALVSSVYTYVKYAKLKELKS